MYVSNQSPYLDDFDEAKKFYRILFRPGRAIQARELTQLQSILQKQIERFGSHIFKEGSLVIPGAQFYEKNYNFVKLQSTYNSVDANDVITSLEGEVLKGLSTGTRARVVKVIASTSSDPPTIYVKYLSSGTTGTSYVFEDNEILEQVTGGTPIVVRAATSDATGLGSAFSISSGVIFVKGVFAYFEDQTLLVSKYSRQTDDSKIGFRITEEVLDSDDDQTLLDPAVGTSNYFAPGADRYKLDLTLEKRDLTFNAAENDTNFIELMRIKNSEVVFIKPRYEYNILADELARRTYDESGDYSVVSHKTQVINHLRSSVNVNDGYLTSSQGGDDNKYAIKVFPGKSYIKGYEIEKLYNTYVIGDKARSFANVNAGPVSVEVGNYINVTDVHSSPDVLTLDKINLYNNYVSAKGSVPGDAILVGNARVRAFEYSSGTVANSSTGVYSLYLFDINMGSGYKFENDVKSVYYDNTGFEDFTANIVPSLVTLTGTATTVNSSNVVSGFGTFFESELYANAIVSIGSQLLKVKTVSNNISFVSTAVATASVSTSSIFLNKAVINQNDKQSYIFPFPYKFIRNIDETETETTYTSRRTIDTNLSLGNVTLTARTDETFAPYSSDNYKILIKQYGRYEDLTNKVTRSGTPTGRTVTFNLSANTNITSDAVRIFATVNKTNRAAIEKVKTLQTNTTVDYTTEAAATAAVVSLGKADVYRLISVSMSSTAFGTSYSSSGATDITNRYSFDNGQRLQYYDVGKITLKPNQAKPTGPIRITFDYFTHSTSGDFFSNDSYTDIDYENIPSVILNGVTYDLRDCLDFRSRIGDDSTFSATSAVINEFLDQETDFQTDYSYYLPKVDKLVLDNQGNLYIVSGVSKNNPEEPTTPDNAMAICVLRQNPYVLDINKDINVTQIDNRRFTMRDIGRIENRVKNLEYYTSLNLLEQQTATLQIQDSQGFDRFKNGFVVDNFSGHGIGDTLNPDYSISIDYNKRELRPQVNQKTRTLYELNTLDAGRTANNYVKFGNYIMPTYTEELFIASSSASRAETINPFNFITFKGVLKLTPSSDNWFDTIEPPVLVENNFGNFDTLVQDNLSVREIDNRYRSVYGNWRDFWYGNERTETKDVLDSAGIKQNVTRTTDVVLNSTGNRYEISETLDTTVSGDKVLSRVVLPKMRDVTISFNVKGMKPNTKLYAFFDDIDVTKYTKISFNRANVIATLTSDSVYNVLTTADLVTDQFGSLDGAFNYSSSDLNLVTGDKVFRLTDSAFNDDGKSTVADAVFSATGQLYVTNKVLVRGPRGATGATGAPGSPGTTTVVYAGGPRGPTGPTGIDGGGGGSIGGTGPRSPVPDDPTNIGIVNVGLAGSGWRNNDGVQDYWENYLNEAGFSTSGISSIASATGFAGADNIGNYIDNGNARGTSFDYIGVFDSLRGGAMEAAINSASAADRNNLVNFYEGTYNAIHDYAMLALTENDIIAKVDNDINDTTQNFKDTGDKVYDIIYEYKTNEDFRTAVDARVLADTGSPPIWDAGQIANYAAVFLAYETVGNTMANQDAGVVANTIRSD